METANTQQLLGEREKLLEKLCGFSHLLHGTWVERYSVCSRPHCKCHQGERHGPRHYLAITGHGRQRQKYIANSQASAALHGIEQDRIVQDILEEITRINLQLIKEGTYADS
jgi:hypothetical protein